MHEHVIGHGQNVAVHADLREDDDLDEQKEEGQLDVTLDTSHRDDGFKLISLT